MQERRASASAFFVAILFNLLSIRNVLQHIPEEHKRGEVLKPRYKYTGRGIMTPTQAAPMLLIMTDKEKIAFYGSKKWDMKRLYILHRDHFECQECRRRIAEAKAKGIELPASDRWIRRATLVHHIQHLEDRPDLALEDSNLEAVCMECHNRLHGRTVNDFANKKRKKRLTAERW